MSDTQIVLDRPLISEDDEPEVSHIVRKEDQMIGYMAGRPIVALCGVIFIPTRDPEKFPVCQKCQARLKELNAARRGAN